jgi:hypothetical protein
MDSRIQLNPEFLKIFETSKKFDPLGVINAFLKLTNPELGQVWEEDMDALIETGVLKYDYSLQCDFVAIEPLISVDTVNTSTIDDAFVDQYRELFSKQSLGNYWRTGMQGDRKDVAKKLRIIMKEEKYSKEDILNAVKYYRQKLFEGGLSYSYQADYFLKKNGRSPLRSFYEEMGTNTNDGFDELI